MSPRQESHTSLRVSQLLNFARFLEQHPGGISVAEAAERFGVTPQRVDELVRALFDSGVPGDMVEYSPEDMFDIDFDLYEERGIISLRHNVGFNGRLRFSSLEAAAITAGLQVLIGRGELERDDTMRTLLDRLRRSSSEDALDIAADAQPSPILQTLRTALHDDVQVRLRYVSASGLTERTVDPLLLESRDTVWYLAAWCHLRRAQRWFKVDAMSDVRVLASPREHRAGDPGISLPTRRGAPTNRRESKITGPAFTPRRSHPEVHVRADELGLRVIEEFLPRESARPRLDPDGMARASLRVRDERALVRLVTAAPGHVHIEGPPAERARVADWAARALEVHAHPE